VAFVSLLDDYPKIIRKIVHMRFKIKLPFTKITNIKHRWITSIVYMRVRDRCVGGAPLFLMALPLPIISL
jgi:hypothetical protein